MVPRAPAHLSGKQPRARNPARGAASGGQRELNEPIARLLVVDDHIDARLLLEEFFQEHGFYVTVAKDGDEALALLHGGLDFDLMILDLAMPRVDGYALLQALRRAPSKLRNLPVVVLSGISTGRLPGVAAQLQKPAPLDRVLAAVRKSIAKH